MLADDMIRAISDSKARQRRQFCAGGQRNGETHMAESLSRFLGDTPGRLIVKLVVVSIIAGFVMRSFGWYPTDILNGIRDFLAELWHTGFRAFGRIGDYFMLGAVVVIPAFIILRLLSYRR
jgi:hypothetical protein